MRLVASLTIGLLVCGCSCRDSSPPQTGQRVKSVPTADETEQQTARGVRLCIVTPDLHIHTVADREYADWADERHRSGDGSTPFRGLILSDSRISEIRQIIRKHHTVPWQPMLAETPYPRNHTAILLYQVAGDGLMCSIGGPRRARNVLEQIIDRIPSEHRTGLRKSIDNMESTQPADQR